MVFKVVFSHWINDYEPAIVGPVSPEALWDYEFSVEANNLEEAKRIALKYEGLETHASEGIGKLKHIFKITAKEACNLQPITIYQDYFPEERARKTRIAILENKLFEILKDLAQEYGMSPGEERKFIGITLIREIEKMITCKKQSKK